MDKLSVISNQLLAQKDRSQIKPGSKEETKRAGQQDIELKKVAKEMESLFAFQLLKVMREASKGLASEEKGLGQDTYMGMFDMEVSRLLSERGLGLQDALMEQLGRMANINETEK
jgi:Rod binding domain-containing protein